MSGGNKYLAENQKRIKIKNAKTKTDKKGSVFKQYYVYQTHC